MTDTDMNVLERPALPTDVDYNNDSDRFRPIVKQRAANHDPALIDCSQPNRFGIVIREMFDISKSRIAVFTDHLCRLSSRHVKMRIAECEAYWINPEVIEGARNFLSGPGRCLDIIVAEKLDCQDRADEGLARLRGHEFLRDVVADQRREGTLTLYLCQKRKTASVSLLPTNFFVADDNGYRLETSTSYQKAIVRFGCADINEELFEKFDQMRSSLDQALAKDRDILKLEYAAGAKDIAHPTGTFPIGGVKLSDFVEARSPCPIP